MKKVLLACSVLALAACQTTYAQKPIPMMPRVKQYFADWAALPNAGVFAVSKDGRAAGVAYCPEFGGCAGANEQNALAACNNSSGGSPCVVYGVGGKPVVKDEDLERYLQRVKGDRSRFSN